MTQKSTAPSIRILLEAVLPPILFRNHPKFREWTGLSPRTVTNEDCKGMGPKRRITVGKVCGYPKEDLLDYLEAKVRGHQPY